MNVRSLKDLNEEDLNLFNEEDWNFLSSNSSHTKNFSYFENIRNNEFSDTKSVLKSIATTVGVFILCVCTLIVGYVVFSDLIKNNISFDKDVINAVTEVDNTKLKHVEGKEISSEDFIKVSSLFNNYFSILNSKAGYEVLNSVCDNNISNFSKLESYYRQNSVYSYDYNDCYSRALCEFARFIKLDKVNSVIEKDNNYYCYITLSVPDISSLYEYYNIYSYDMTKYFGVNSLTSINVTKYLLKVTANNDLPLINKEFLFILSKKDNNFIINDDTQVSSLCTDTYTNSINQLTTILGSKLVTGTYTN